MSKGNDEKYVRRANREVVRVDDLRTILTEATTEPKRHRSFEALVGLVIEALPDVSPDYRVALIFRLQALGHLAEAGAVPGFTQKGPDEGLSLISDAAVAAAATCTLHVGSENRVVFDTSEFNLVALKAADVEGSG